MTAYARWADIRGEHVEWIGRAEFEAGNKQMLAGACGNHVLSQATPAK
ncbi:MAG TPA: hypothetical protein VMU94_19940 [Streptosporangiaceae bacterium]|nr:hypothetical protein [Streptosporangiaceae bacterium]